MAGLLGDLINASRALAAHQVGVQVAGRNLANVNTEGYSRQRVVLGDRAVDSRYGITGSGVEALGVKQIRDTFLDLQVTQETSRMSYLTAQQDALAKAESALGERIDRSNDAASLGDATGASSGLATALNDFFTGFDSVAASPGELSTKQVLLQRAETLVDKFNVTDERLEALQTDLTEQITGDAAKATGLLDQIADLNRQIASAEVGNPGSALLLRDQRQARLEELGQYMNFTSSVIPETGLVRISVKDTDGNSVTLVEGGTRVGSVGFDGTGFTGPGGVSLAIGSGSLAGNLTARDGTIQQLRDDLTAAATQLAKAVNAAYNPTSTAGGDFFKVPPTSGVIQIEPTLTAANLKTTDTGNSGGNELALAVAGVVNQRFSTAGGDAIDGTIGSFYGKVVSGFGEAIVQNDTKLADQQIVTSMVRQQRDSVSGVSMDEEVADLMKFQRAYQASSRVISAIDSMLESLINSVR